MDERDALLILARIMSGEENIIEHMEKEGQDEAIRRIQTAKRMQPAQEEWEKLGFTFEEIGDSVLYKATLPEGWSMRATGHSMWNEFYDQNGYKRGSMFYKAAFYDRSAHMSLCARYGIHTKATDEDTTVVYFGNEHEELFVAGEIKAERYSDEYYEQLDELDTKASAFASAYYPEWRNPLAYWDEKGLQRKHTPTTE